MNVPLLPAEDFVAATKNRRFIQFYQSGSLRYLIICISSVILLSYMNRTEKRHIPRYIGHENHRNYSEQVKERIRYALAHKDLTSSLSILPFKKLKSIYRVAPRYNFSSCEIEKTMSTLFLGVFCYLYDTEEFVNAGRIMQREWWPTRFCKDKNEYWDTRALVKNLPQRLTTIFVVRDPLERFVSGFVNKCIDEVIIDATVCYKCGGDLDCVIYKVLKELQDISLGKILVKGNPSYEARHFAPLSWYCDLADRFEDYVFMKTSSSYNQERANMHENFAAIMRDQGVEEEHISVIKKNITRPKSMHRTFGSSRSTMIMQQIRTNRDYMKIILEIYRSDYEIFDFKLPRLPPQPVDTAISSFQVVF